MRLGQNSGNWVARAADAVLAYDALVRRLAEIASADARGQILDWLGREDVPGSPAERYAAVRGDLEAGIPYGEIEINRAAQLEENVRELESRVENALAGYGTISAPATGAETVSWAGLSRSGLVAGGIGLLALVAIPVLVS